MEKLHLMRRNLEQLLKQTQMLFQNFSQVKKMKMEEDLMALLRV